MVMSPEAKDELTPVIVSTSFCFVLISFRCLYRTFYRCKWHTNCFRKWHQEDSLMAMSLTILGARAACISTHIVLGNRTVTNSSLSTSQLESDWVIAKKIVLPARIFYALFLWCMKLCLLNFYSRISSEIPAFERAANILRIALVVTFVAILFPTLLECRPMSLYWNNSPRGDQCREARANLVTMGIFNIITDIALILFPIPLVLKPAMPLKKRIRLVALFSAGLVVVIITITRLPITLQGSVPQRIRSLWADIEIACACLVANAPFFYPLIKETINGHPVNPDGGLRRNPLSQQWEVSRLPSYPNVRLMEEELKIDVVDAERRGVGGRKVSSSGKGWQANSDVQDGTRISVMHVEGLPLDIKLNTTTAL